MLPDADFEFIRALVHRESGIALTPDKQYLVTSRLAPLMKKHDIPNIRTLVQQLRAKSNPTITREIIDLMTTNESWFFRDHWPYECMREVVLPDLSVRRSAQRNLDIWSAACSSGQEPYSIAMVVREEATSVGGWNVKITGTDISPTMLERCKHGKFTRTEMTRGLTAAQKARFFTQVGTDSQAREELRNMLDLKLLNLTKAWPRLPQFDVIFIRNVLIYFDLPTKQDILRRVERLLNPGGYLFLGSGETMVDIATKLKPVSYKSNSFYQLPG